MIDHAAVNVRDIDAAKRFLENHGKVDEFYDAAIAAGGTDNGAPGIRPHYHENYYGAFVHDADGNNIEAVCQTPQ